MRKLVIVCGCVLAVLAGGCNSFDAPTDAPNPMDPVDALIETVLAAHEAATETVRPGKIIVQAWEMDAAPPEVADEVLRRADADGLWDRVAAGDEPMDAWILDFAASPGAMAVGVRCRAYATSWPTYSVSVTKDADGLRIGGAVAAGRTTVRYASDFYGSVGACS